MQSNQAQQLQAAIGFSQQAACNLDNDHRYFEHNALAQKLASSGPAVASPVQNASTLLGIASKTVDSLDDALGELHNARSALQNKLVPITYFDAPSPQGIQQEEPAKSSDTTQLGHELLELIDRIREARSKVLVLTAQIHELSAAVRL